MSALKDNDMITKFIASRGITRVAEGEGVHNDYTYRDWRKKERGEPTQNELIAQRRLAVTDASGREFWVNGLGERLT